jgi:hypothetical protein
MRCRAIVPPRGSQGPSPLSAGEGQGWVRHFYQIGRKRSPRVSMQGAAPVWWRPSPRVRRLAVHLWRPAAP